MAVSMTITPEPAHTPPRVRIDLDTGTVGNAFSDITVFRDGQPIRSSAPVGSELSLVYDYDAPYGEPVTYTATGFDSGFTSVLDEDWANLTGWTNEGGAAVAGGKLSAGAVFRSQTPTDQLVIHNAHLLVGAMAYLNGLETVFRVVGNGTTITVQGYLAGSLIWSVPTQPGTGDWVLVDNHVESTAGTWTLPTGPDSSGLVLECQAVVPAFELLNHSTPVPFSVSAAPATLDATEAWLIHPTDPDLSVELTTTVNGRRRRDRIWVDATSAQQVTYPAQRTVYAPLGRPRQVPVTYGDRRPGQWSLVVHTPRDVDRAAMRSLLTDQAPLLLRTPPGFGWDLDDDWYSVDDVDDSRVVDLPSKNPRIFSLPLIPVDEPVLFQGAQWTWADVGATYATWADLEAAYATWLAVLAGPGA